MTRIDINGQWHEIEGPITIDRNITGALSVAMSEYEWTSFCDRIDDVLASATLLKHEARGYGKRLIIFMLVAAVAIISVFFSVSFSVFHLGQRGTYKVTFYFIPLGFFTFFVAVYVAARVSNHRMLPLIRKLQLIVKDAEQVCEDESKKRSNVSFHIREEIKKIGNGEDRPLNYIECFVGAAGPGDHIGFQAPPQPVVPTPMFDQKINNDPEVVVPAVVVPSAPAFAVSSGGADIADRLKRLEGIKDIITEEEYTQRRKEILTEI